MGLDPCSDVVETRREELTYFLSVLKNIQK